MATGGKAGATVLTLAAWGVNLAFDGLSLVAAPVAPPHLLHAYMPEAIRGMVSPAVLAPVTSAVLAAIALLVLSLVPPGTPRRVLRLTGWLVGFWLLSEGLLAWVWLDAPGVVVAISLAAGIPRSLAVAVVLSWLQGPPAEQR
jgi:hypothetical protein